MKPSEIAICLPAKNSEFRTTAFVRHTEVASTSSSFHFVDLAKFFCCEQAYRLRRRHRVLASLERAGFCLYVHHTDADREWAYDRISSVGRLDKGLVEAQAKGWTVADMKQEWKVIYPPAKK
jgi:hypothetical protein